MNRTRRRVAIDGKALSNMNLVRSSLRAKLTVAFGAVAVGFLVAVAVGFTGISGVGNSTASQYRKAVIANEASADAFNMRVSQSQDTSSRRFIKNPDGSNMHKGDIAAFNKTVAALKQIATSPSEKAALAHLDALFASWQAADDKSASLWQHGRYTAATEYVNGEANSRGDALSAALAAFAAKAQAQAQATESSQVGRAHTLMAIFSAVALLGAALVVFFLTRSIKRGVGQVLGGLQSLNEHCLASLGTGLDAIAAGDLTWEARTATGPVAAEARDEIGELSRTFNSMLAKAQAGVASYNAARDQLQTMVGKIDQAAGQLSSASQQMASTSEEAGRAVGEIANAVGDVAQGAERQVRMVEEARESTDATARVAGETRTAADQGVDAARRAAEAMHSVRDASDAVSQAMVGLSGKSEQIGGIVETITGIAGQTNLLALNAAIEAARAGEQGKGFAVVAEEVRKLAEESQHAAATIASLIAEIQAETTRTAEVVEEGTRRSADGVEVVEEAREAFLRIGVSVEDVTGRIASIAAAMGEVAAVAEQSSASSEEVSASTEQTSASTQEIAASAQELAHTAEELERLVTHFKVAR
jgi:methyl-accepting chemotaxis protein